VLLKPASWKPLHWLYNQISHNGWVSWSKKSL